MRQDFVPFELERVMSIWEHRVQYNLSESGVKPLTLRELFQDDPRQWDLLLDTELNYPQTNGIPELRERIAALYPGASPDNVVVTSGAAQANFTAVLTTLDPGDEIVVMLPNYMQIWGVAKNYGVQIRSFPLRPELGWGFDPDDLRRAVTNSTRLIAVCNPNNPTGHIMSAEEMEAVVQAADRVGAWILADEVYAGAEHWTDEVTPSFWGRYPRTLAIGSLSKAYALPGLRLGWVVAPADTADEIWARQDYITICPTMLGNRLAAYALSPEVRPRILARTREYVRRGYANFERWCTSHADLFSLTRPQAAAIAFVRYHRDINSTELVNRLIHEQQTYVVPGDHFGMDHYLRISYGLPESYVNEGLNRLLKVLTNND
ncbi:MAG: aminotransferase class I/II-fold pyridoxal phosphate-dependent enzyme [Chloroflexi bacterium]|nr:MAG: aminotransferase class I/II-fold pyridoxal phosphate-dependent enzyme [Chloroflexota bacterium]